MRRGIITQRDGWHPPVGSRFFLKGRARCRRLRSCCRPRPTGSAYA